MTIWTIQNAEGHNIGTVNAADTEEQAIAKFVVSKAQPMWCRLHDEMPADRRSGAPGEMGFYQPQMPKPVKAIAMKEIYSGGGYCIIPA